jgi:hypothetical protein
MGALTMKNPSTVFGSKELGKRATVYNSGLVVLRFWTNTILGENSAAFERQFPSLADAIAFAQNWVNSN